MITKEKLKELLKDEFEECTKEDEPTHDGYGGTFLNQGFIWTNLDGENIYFKPKQKFPIVFEGEHYNFFIDKQGSNYFLTLRKLGEYSYFTEKDIKQIKKH